LTDDNKINGLQESGHLKHTKGWKEKTIKLPWSISCTPLTRAYDTRPEYEVGLF